MKKPLLHRILSLTGDSRIQMLGAASFLLCVGLGFWAWHAGITGADLRMWFGETLAFLRHHPYLLFFAIVLLPALPVPASPLLILSGIVYGSQFGMPVACAITILGLVLNMSWTYAVAAGPARALVERLMRRLEVHVPKLSTGGAFQLILIMRITPGFPFFLQNLVLGFLRVPFRLYLPMSAALTSIFAIGFVVSGGAIFKGNFSLALLGVVLVVLAITLTGWLRKRYAAKPAIGPDPEE